MMTEDPKDAPAFDPQNAGGGAVDDLTPPSEHKFDPSKALDQTQPYVHPSGSNVPHTLSGVEINLTGEPVIKPARNTEQINRTPLKGGTSPAALAGAVLGEDIQIQDLTQEQLLRNTARITYRGQSCPSLNGIPLISKLGQGGMGAVYCGINPRLGNRVAVKVLPLHMAAADAGLVQRLVREAQLAAMIQSPHLATVYDVNEEDGQFFIVMEYVTGVTVGQYLKQLVKDGQRGMKELDAIDVCIAASIGLDAAHQESVIHRDLKPENIMIPYRSRQQNQLDLKRAKLMDLGLARSEKGTASQDLSLTGLKVAMGTPGYMSPEQIMNARTASKPSDVYGMGATLYAMLTGRSPYKEADDTSDVMRVIFATVNDPLVPVSKKRDDISPAVDKLVSKCLEKKPEDRFPDAHELVRALVAVRRSLSSSTSYDDLDGNAVTKAPPGSGGYAGEATLLAKTSVMGRAKRNKGWVLASTGAVVLAGAAAYTLFVYKPNYSDAKRSSIIELHENTIKSVYQHMHTDRARAIEMLKIAQEDTSKNSGIPELIQHDATASLFIQIEGDLVKPDLKLEDVKALANKVANAITTSDDEKAESKALLQKIEKAERELKFKGAEELLYRNDIPASQRHVALNDLLAMDPNNAKALAMKPEIERAEKQEQAKALYDRARKHARDGFFEIALNEVKDALALHETDRSKDLRDKLAGKLKRISQQTKFDQEFTRLETAYNAALTGLTAEKFDDAQRDASDAEAHLKAAKEIDPAFKPDAQVDSLVKRIEESRKSSEYRSALAGIRELIDRKSLDEAEKKLSDTKALKPADETGFEAADLLDQVNHLQYAKALDAARALKSGPDFDAALKQIEVASLKKPADEPGTALAELKRDVAEARNKTAFEQDLKAAFALHAEGKNHDALLKIDDVRELVTTLTGSVDLSKLDALEKEIVAEKHKELLDSMVAESKAKNDRALEQQRNLAKQRVAAAIERGRQLVAMQKYDEAVTAYIVAKSEARKFELAEVSTLDNLATKAKAIKQENSAEAKKKRRLDEAMAESSATALPDVGLDTAIAALETKYSDLDDAVWTARRSELRARQTRLADAKKAAGVKRAFDGALVAFKNEKYDDAIALLNTSGLSKAATAVADLKKMIQDAREDASKYESAYTSRGGSKEKVAPLHPELDAKFTAALKGLNSLNEAALSRLESFGMNGVDTAVDKAREDNKIANKNIEDAWTAVFAAYKKVLSDEANATVANRSNTISTSGSTGGGSSGNGGGKIRTGETESGR